jgi:signal transduction histidine kinase
MNDLKKEYLDKLLGISTEMEDFSLNFKDENLEINYRKSDLKELIKKSKISCIILIFTYILIIVYTLINNHEFVLNTFILLGVLGLELLITIIGHNIALNYKHFYSLMYVRFFLFYFTGIYMFHFRDDKSDTITNYKFLHGFFNYLNFLYLFMIEFNYFMLIGIPVLNSLFIISLKFNGFFGQTNIYYDLIGMFTYYFATFFIKKEDYHNKRLVYYDNFKNNNYIDYIINLIDGLNNMVISSSKNDIIFINNFTNEYLEKKGYFKNICNINEEIKENELKTCYEGENFLNKKISCSTKFFFESLVLDYLPSFKFNPGTRLSKIMTEIQTINYFESNNIYKLGYFSINYQNSIEYFEVYLRKLKFKDEILEILIYDVTDVKQAEKINIESNLKQKILSRIAHEFKTPLITIITLISKLLKINTEGSNFNKVNLLHVNNLSNYVLSLISDMINYVSNCTDLNLIITKVDLKDVILYCYNILNTLIECNENKQGKIKTILEIDDNLMNINVKTDENKLKQIILNLTSNAYKFTHSGFIKIKANIKKSSKMIQLYIKDSGIGIKEEDKKSIFQENFQINLDQEHNEKGKNIGLAITKNLANSMNLEVGFKSTYLVGSKFHIKFPPLVVVDYYKTFINLECLSRVEQDIDRSEDVLLFDNKLPVNQDEIITKRINYDLIKYEEPEIKDSFEESLFVESGNNHIHRSISFTLGFKDSQKDLIVVIDDHKLVRENTINLIKMVLKNFNCKNFDIIEGSDGIDLLRLVMKDKEGKIKYIFCDENMQYLNRSETVKIIRSLEVNKKIIKYYIVSVTAYDDDNTQRKIHESGFNLVINKPCTKTIISEILFENKNV